MFFKYKSKCRFTILIALPDRIIDIRPGQVIQLGYLIDHPHLDLLNEVKKNKKVDPPEV
jgi:hypothetical protein